MHPRVSILGCGWLGLPLAKHLVRQGYAVKGSTTMPEKLATLAEVGIKPHLIRLGADVQGERPAAFFEADVLFLNIPPGRRDPDVRARFAERIAAVQQALRASPIKQVLFASSTSVYPNLNRVVTEEDAGDPPTDSGKALLAAEQALASVDGFETTVLRLAGLYGYDRRPGRFLAGKHDLEGGETPVNLLHRDDAVAIAAALLQTEPRGEVFNACSDVHPPRHTFYPWAARQLGLEPPTFKEEAATPFKVVSNEKLKRHLGYHFLYPDPMAEAP